MEQTKLQKIIEQKADQIRIAIEEAIDEGANVKVIFSPDTIEIDGVRVFSNLDKTNSVVLRFHSDKIAKKFEPSKDDLAELADKKRKELEEIERQIKERTNDETDRN